MTSERHDPRTSTLRDYLNVLLRRKWLVLACVVIVPLVAVLLSVRQQKLYSATAEVLLSRQNLASSLSNVADPNAGLQADRVAQTQVYLASVPTVAARTIAALKLTDRTAQQLLAHSSVTAKTNADLLDFTVTDPSPTLATQLATTYARQYTIYRRELDTNAIVRARSEVQSNLASLRAAGNARSALYASLVEKDQQLATLEALQTSNALVVQRASKAGKVQPRPKRDGILGLALGLALGLGLAFLWEALDTRVRTAEEIRERLGKLPLLARLPAPPRALQRRNRLVMLDEPTSHAAEAFRMLRTNLDFVQLDNGARTIMVTSAVEQEGKSTTIANLAVALARAGQRVVLVDLDLRRPYLDRFFDLAGRPGITQVALGHVPLADALAPIVLTGATSDASAAHTANGSGNGSGYVPIQGLLEVLPPGPIPPDPGEFVGTKALAHVIEQLRERAEIVLIDAPPVLHVSDAMTLGSVVDGIIVVTRLNMVKRPMLTELLRQLEAQPAAKLGLVVTDAGAEEGSGYAYGYHGYHARTEVRSARAEARAARKEAKSP